MSVRTSSLPCLLALLPLALLLPGAKQAEAPGVITGRVVEWKEDPITRTTRGGRPAGRTEPDTGERKGGPIAGATIRLEGPASRVIVRTDGQGRFRTAGLAPGKWTCYWECTGWYEKREVDVPGLVSKRPVVELASGGQAEIELPMRRCSILTGRVLSPGVDPAANCRLWLVSPGGSPYYVLSYLTKTDASGAYLCYIPYDGKSQFGLVCPDIGYAPLTDVTLVAGEKTRLDFRLRPGASVE